MAERYPVQPQEGHYHDTDFKPSGQILSLEWILVLMTRADPDARGRAEAELEWLEVASQVTFLGVHL